VRRKTGNTPGEELLSGTGSEARCSRSLTLSGDAFATPTLGFHVERQLSEFTLFISVMATLIFMPFAVQTIDSALTSRKAE
jgi:hypothetical protein